MNGHKEDSGNAFFLLICLMIAVLFLLPTWYANRAGSINGALLDVAKTQLTVFSAFSAEAYEAWELSLIHISFTVFNTAQIEGFPPKEQQSHAMTDVERNDFVERFIACTGIPVQHHTCLLYTSLLVDGYRLLR